MKIKTNNLDIAGLSLCGFMFTIWALSGISAIVCEAGHGISIADAQGNFNAAIQYWFSKVNITL